MNTCYISSTLVVNKDEYIISHMGKIISRLSDEAVERDEERTWVAGRRQT